jgi:glutaredoxin|tara:strand:+ start:2148 stop:2387 length:240 start_codon:yes stop_codon:yes gene_type:complete
MKAIVWSKNMCGFCVRAKQLLDLHKITYEERNIQGKDWSPKDLFEVVPNAQTLPQIFINDEYIGGFVELEKWLKTKPQN